MFLTTIRIEPASGNPSLAQAWVDTAAAMIDLGLSAWSLATPQRMLSAHYSFNRALAKAWRVT